VPRQTASRNAAAIAVVVLGLVLVAVFALKPADQNGGSPAVVAPVAHHRAPDFNLVSTTGQKVRLTGLKGHPVLINFWFTNCPPCRTEMPELQRAYQELRPSGVVILGVDAIGEDAATIEAFARPLGITYPLLDNADQSVTRLYRIHATPTSFFVDRHGIIRSVHVGPLTAQDIRAGLGGL
jgi:peroxiredoxin